MKKENGITLIALVVTIIVLLIMAGVTISFLVGENGILGNAEKAAEETKEAKDKERIEMADSALKIDAYNDSNGDNSSIDWTKYYNEDKFNEYLDGKGTASNFVNNSDGTISFEYETDDGEKIKYEVDNKGNLMVNILANKISALNYGDKVAYEANDISDWRIFYKDGENVFIIASDYLPNELINTEKTSLTRSNTYNVSWQVKPEFQISNKLELFKATGYTLNSNYTNSKYTSTLLNIDNWTDFVDSSVASCAIGSPTIEMWLSSWNEKYSDTLSFGTAKNGYKLGYNKNGELSTKINMNAKEGYKVDEADNMYYPHKGAVSNCYGYWLASPVYSTYESNGQIKENFNSMMNVECSGEVGYANGYIEYCLRPVVCLKNTITGKKVNDVWVLE